MGSGDGCRRVEDGSGGEEENGGKDGVLEWEFVGCIELGFLILDEMPLRPVRY